MGDPYEPFELALEPLVQAQGTEIDPAKRRQAILDAQGLIAGNHMLLFTATPVPLNFVQNRVRNTIPEGPASPHFGAAGAGDTLTGTPYEWALWIKRAGP